MINGEILAALKTLQKYNFKETENALKQEAGLADNKSAEEFLKFKAQENDEPESFELKYQILLKFIQQIPDNHKLELECLLYPVFVQLYLRLISGGLHSQAKSFLDTYRKYQEDFYQSDINLLANISDSDHLLLNPLVESFKSSEFVISIAESSYVLLKSLLHEKGLHVIQSILNDQLSLQVIDGPPRTKLQLDCRRGAIFGEAPREANKEPVLYGLLSDPALNIVTDTTKESNSSAGDASGGGDQTADGDGDQTPLKKKKNRRDGTGADNASSRTGAKTDSNSPALDRIPLPKLRDSFVESRQALARETSSLLRGYSRLQPHPTGTSVVLYTVCNLQAGESALSIRRGGLTCASFTDNSAWLAGGFGSGRIRVWSLGPEPLRRMLPASDLASLDKDDSRVKTKMLHDEDDEPHLTRDLLGHVGSVHGVQFCSDKQLLVSGGSDGTVRLWSSVLWGGALTVWRDHVLPVWCATWAPVYGHYFATGSADRSAHLYATDHSPEALRVFVGHHADVTAVCIHPNVNYLATGCADLTVRLFDIRSGKMVRLYTGHKGSVQCLAFSPCGRYLASGGWCGTVCLWDLSTGHQVGQLGGYSANTTSDSRLNETSTNSSPPPASSHWLTGPVVSLTFSPDQSNHLATGGLEGAIRVWDTSSGRVSSTRRPSQTPTVASPDPTTPGSSTSGNRSSSNGLVALHRVTKQQIARDQRMQRVANYYTPATGSSVSDACLAETYFTRRTSVLALQYVHPQLLLAVGPYNQC